MPAMPFAQPIAPWHVRCDNGLTLKRPSGVHSNRPLSYSTCQGLPILRIHTAILWIFCFSRRAVARQRLILA